MTLRLGIVQNKAFSNALRYYSSTLKMLNVSLDDETGFTTVILKRPPVNSLNFEFLSEFSSVLSELEQNKSKGMILTSFSNKVFSAGLDIHELCKPNKTRFEAFWTSLQDVWMKLYGSSFPTVAVINGHAPAGGCVLSMSCEYRIMLNDFTIGLNETRLGIVVPIWVVHTMLNIVNKRDAELALLAGRLFKTEEALKVGLIDEVAANKAQALGRARSFLNQYEMMSPATRVFTKNYIRSDIEVLKKTMEKDTETIFNVISQPEVQKRLEFYFTMLKTKKNGIN